MLCFSLTEAGLEPGIAHEDFYSPLFDDRIEEASIRLITGGTWDLRTLSDAIKNGVPHAVLCCLVELIPPTGNNTSTVFPAETCLLSIPYNKVEKSPNDKSVLFTSEGKKLLYGCRPESTFLRVGDKQIVNNKGKLKLVKAPKLADEFDDPYHQYKGQDISVLELL